MAESRETAVIVDGGASWGKDVVSMLGGYPITAHRVPSPRAALDAMDAEFVCTVVMGLELPGADALAFLSTLKERHPSVPVVAVGADLSVNQVVEAMRRGAADVVVPPFTPEALRAVVERSVVAASAASEALPCEEGVLGAATSTRELRELIQKAAAGSATVLIRGESGTGKEVAARAIHAAGPRARMPFVKIQCGALPDALLESELFGYERGAFTGAQSRKLGRVELAQGGTLFLDEIGDVTPAMQVKLLRLLQDRQFERLGGNSTLEVDGRFIAATHRDLDSMIVQGEFREDLYYRLAVIPIWIAPLRTRREDIEPLARHFCQRFAQANGKTGVELTERAVKALRRQRWPGNVRQLQNVVERLVVLASGTTIDEEDVLQESKAPPVFVTQGTGTNPTVPGLSAAGSLDGERRCAERKALLQALEKAHGNRTVAARVLGVSRRTLYNLLAEHGVA